jgi:hypothetical protein
VITGRCVTAEDGAPLGGVQIMLAFGSEREPERVASAADGHFRIEHARPATSWLSLSLRATNRVPESASLTHLVEKLALDLGDIRLWFGTMVRGRVIDERGQPVDFAKLTFAGEVPAVAPPFKPHNPAPILHSDKEGRFALGNPLPSGTWQVLVHEPFTLSQPTSFVLQPGELQRELLIELTGVAELATISGRVQDPRGAPVAGIGVSAVGIGPPRFTGSRQDGSFLLRGNRADRLEEPVQLLVDNVTYDSPPAAVCRWGDKDLVLTVHRSGAVGLRVVEAITGMAVPHYDVRCALQPGPGRTPHRA